jgi:uncharacterized protein involved in type VI secretion and phage assembly
MQQPYNTANGIVIGLVSDLRDPDGMARVRVTFPHLANAESEWARLAAPMAGNQRGIFFCPEVGDEVLVAFEQGDPRRPYIIGALWSRVDQPPPEVGPREQNNQRMIVSRSNHIILLDDTPGAEKIVLVDKDNARRVVIDSANSVIQVQADQGRIEVKAASGDVSVEGVNVSIKATSGNLSLTAPAGTVTIQGTQVNIN